jgi:hypothetical protein
MSGARSRIVSQLAGLHAAGTLVDAPDFLAGLRLSRCRGRPMGMRLVPVLVCHAADPTMRGDRPEPPSRAARYGLVVWTGEGR